VIGSLFPAHTKCKHCSFLYINLFLLINKEEDKTFQTELLQVFPGFSLLLLPQ
jgi:hypothetical protein